MFSFSPPRLLPSRTLGLMLGSALSLLALTGCKLVDQRTFDPRAGFPPVPHLPPAPPAPPTPPPFLRIEAGTPAATYGPVVERAAKAALARKTNVLFIVQGFAPMQPDPVAQASALSAVTKDEAAPVAALIAAAGARPVQIEMHALTDPSARHAYVRVDLR